MNLIDLIKAGIAGITTPLEDEEKAFISEIEGRLLGLGNQEGSLAADAVVRKMYKQRKDHYQGAPGDVGMDGKTNEQRLAQDGFLEFRHYLRAGNTSYPGAPDIPALHWIADAVYDLGGCRTQIHNWCNAASKKLLANPPTD